ncbi:MAG: ABC transporter ATP-binding protein [Clostridiaceae bacterium]|jgi:putative ABC transport system ATP-binding protein|nr:ABC transporter ATP-binding protein [Clostridiaceae bacterium]
MIKIKNMYKIYKMGETEVRALDGVSLHIRQNEFVAIVGPSGSGKTTLMNMIGCLDTPTEGKYYIDGIDTDKMNDTHLADLRNRKIGFIFQSYNLLGKLSVLENVELPLIYLGKTKSERLALAKEAIKRVGLEGRERHKPNQLSGGQQQRVAVARALANNPALILADEPTGALDSKTGFELLEMLKDIHKAGNTIVLITHDKEIAQNAKRIISIHDGKIYSDTEMEVGII